MFKEINKSVLECLDPRLIWFSSKSLDARIKGILPPLVNMRYLGHALWIK